MGKKFTVGESYGIKKFNSVWTISRKTKNFVWIKNYNFCEGAAVLELKRKIKIDNLGNEYILTPFNAILSASDL